MTITIPRITNGFHPLEKFPPKGEDAVANTFLTLEDGKRDAKHNLPLRSNDPRYLEGYATQLRMQYLNAIASLEEMQRIAYQTVQGEQHPCLEEKH